MYQLPKHCASLKKLDIVKKGYSLCYLCSYSHKVFFIRIYSSPLRAATSRIEPSYQAGQAEGNERCNDVMHAMFLRVFLTLRLIWIVCFSF